MVGGPFLPAPCWQASARKLRAGRRATKAEHAMGFYPEHPCCPGQGRGAGLWPRQGGEGTGGETVRPAACQGGDGRTVTAALSYFAARARGARPPSRWGANGGKQDRHDSCPPGPQLLKLTV